jgi:plasmid stabilization system protein ParE
VEDYEVIWSLRAVAELDAIGEYIARDRPAAARRETAALQARVGQLARFPFSGAKFRRRREGLYREITYRKYRIFYRVDRRAKRVFVATVWHGARRDPRTFD